MLVAGDKIGVLTATMTEHDNNLMNSFDFCVNEMYEEALQWVYEEGERPIEFIESGLQKCRVSIDKKSFFKSLCFWKKLMKKEIYRYHYHKKITNPAFLLEFDKTWRRHQDATHTIIKSSYAT